MTCQKYRANGPSCDVLYSNGIAHIINESTCARCKSESGMNWPPEYGSLPTVLEVIRTNYEKVRNEVISVPQVRDEPSAVVVTPVCKYRGEMLTFDCCSPNDYVCSHPEVSVENGGVAVAGACGQKCRGFMER